MKRKGIFVSIDGPNGVGKSTIVEGLAANFRGKGLKLHLTKEVTETTLGKFIRSVHKEYHGKTLALLLAADRQNHVDNDIFPALQTHDIVITDRYVDSSLVFQRLDGVESSFIWNLNSDFLKPDLSISITASAEVIAGRLATRKSFDRFEQSFTRAEEVRLFKDAASFLKRKGFNVHIFTNETVDLADATEKLSNEILSLRRKLID